MIVIESLNASTKYYVRVFASTKDGPGNYSKSAAKFTNGGEYRLSLRQSKHIYKATACSFVRLLLAVYVSYKNTKELVHVHIFF